MRLRNNPKAYDILNENSHFVIHEPEKYKNNFHTVFGNDHPIYIEIGMGKGDFIYENSLRYPDINFIGIEKYPSVLAAAVNKINKKELPKNLRLIHYDAIELNQLFDNQSIQTIYLNFSDPWPKKKHEKRRLTSSQFLDVYKKILSHDGHIEFKSDNRGLFEYSLLSLNQYGMNFDYVSLDLHHSAEADENIQTEYERKFSVNGPIYKITTSYKENQNG